MFFAGRLTQGIGIGGEWAIGHGMLAEAVAPRMRGRAAAALQAGEPFGVAIAALVGYLVLPRVGWRAVLVGSSVTALLAVAARASVHLPDRPSADLTRPYLVELRAAARVPGLRRRFAAAWLLGRLQARHLLELLHLAADVPQPRDAPERRAVAHLDGDGPGSGSSAAC